jgi:hypothetical protein
MAFAAFSTAADRSETSERPHVATWHSGLINTGGNGASSFSKLGTDTLSIYGGPGSLLGKFQDINGIIPDQQGWLEVDSTDQPALWQASTFNSPNGSTSMWAGQTAAQQPGYTSAPGYGNNWNALLTYTKTVSNPAAGQTVGLSFLFNYEVETAFDFFNVEYDSFGATIPVLSLTGSNRDTNGVFQPVSFPTGAETHAIS